MKTTRNILIIMMSVLMIFMNVHFVNAEDPPQGFEETEKPVIYNDSDSSGLPSYGQDNPDAHGIVDTSEATEITSLISPDAWERAIKDMDMVLNFQPVENEAVSAVLGKVDNFVNSGALTSYLENGNLLLGSEIGLTANRNDKVKVLGTEANASSWVYVVDKDAMCIVVKNADGEGIESPLVTISYLNSKGERITQSVVGTAAPVAGIVAFDGLPESFYGVLDIEAAGYHAVSILDKHMEAGKHYTFTLDKAKENEIYIRGVDLSGKDLVNEETKILLQEDGTDELNLKVMVSKTGNASFPGSIEVYSENRSKTILTISQQESYSYGSNTIVYSASRKWIETSSNLLAVDDIIAIRYNDQIKRLEHLTIEKAICKPGLVESNMPVTTSPMPGEISDRMGGTGWLNFTAQVLQVPIVSGFYPDGTGFIMASYDITNLDKDTQYKYSELFNKSWNPKNCESTAPIMEVFQKSFWENAEKVKKGDQVLNSPKKVQCLRNANYNFSMSFSLFFCANYNKQTQDYYGTGGLIFTEGLTVGVTEYFVFMAGPFAIPVYIGFEAGISVSAALNINFAIDEPPMDQAKDYKWRYASGGDTDATARIEVILSFSIFGGIGVKGILGVCATGFANTDIATVLGKGKGSVFTAEPHSFIDFFYGFKIDWYLLFFSGTIKVTPISGAVRIYDSNGESDNLQDYTITTEWKPLSLEACKDVLVPQLTGDGDNVYTIANNLTGPSNQASIENVDNKTYPDSQVQYVAVKDHTALFRVISNGTRTMLVYQFMNNETGSIDPEVYEVQLPDDRSVSEFMAVGNKTDQNNPDYSNNVYIGAVLVDANVSEMADKAKTSDVAAITVNLDQKKTISSRIMTAKQDGAVHYYSAPRPAGCEDYCVVAYTQTPVDTVENTEQLLESINSSSSNFLATFSPDTPDQISYIGLGTERIHTTGAIAPYEPSFWKADQFRSTDKTLVLRGYASNGYTSDNDGRCLTSFDISDIKVQEFNYDRIITNWQYLNGRNYFLAGNSVYWMNKQANGDDDQNFSWITQKVENGSGMVDVEGRYAMITNNNQSAIYIVGVIQDWEVDVENSTSTKTGNRVQISTLITNRYESTPPRYTCELHGPLTIDFGYGDEVKAFTAAYHPADCLAKGISIIYSTPLEEEPQEKESVLMMADTNEEQQEEAAEAVAIKQWKQNAERGMRVVGVSIPQNLITTETRYLGLNVSFRNYGYAKESGIMFKVWDDAGNRLACTNGKTDFTDDDTLWIRDTYTGDTRTTVVMVKVPGNWKANELHEIFVEVTDKYYYDGDIGKLNNSSTLQADNTTLTAKNTLINNKHFASVSIKNNRLVGLETPQIKVQLLYQDGEKEETLYFKLPITERLYSYDEEDEEAVEQIYHYDLDMDEIWHQGLEEGLIGAYFSLVDAEGQQKSNEIVYLENPEEQLKDIIIVRKLDENGDPLEGAVISLQLADTEEALLTGTSDSEGLVIFTNVEQGEYLIKETTAPEGYVLNEEAISVITSGKGEVFTVELTNETIKGNVLVNCHDASDPDKKISGIRFAIYRGDELVGYLTENSEGIYEYNDLPYGEYTLRQENAVEGYDKAKDCSFVISENGATVEISISNTPVVSTGDSYNLNYYLIILAISSITSIVLFMVLRRHNKQTI